MLHQVSQPEVVGKPQHPRGERQGVSFLALCKCSLPTAVLNQCPGSRRALLAVSCLLLLLITESLCLQKGFWYWTVFRYVCFSLSFCFLCCIHMALWGDLQMGCGAGLAACAKHSVQPEDACSDLSAVRSCLVCFCNWWRKTGLPWFH